MKKGINIWAFPRTLALEDCLQAAARAGFAGIELAYSLDGPIGPESSRAQMETLRARAADLGLALPSLASGVLWRCNLVSDDPAERAQAQHHVRKQLELAHYLGADTVLVVPGVIGTAEAPEPAVADYAVAYERGVAALRDLARVAEEYGVAIGVENVWNRFLTGPLELRDFVDAVGHPLVGVYFDVGNVLKVGYPEQWIRLLGPRIKKVHVKDFRLGVGTLRGFVELLEGDVNFPAVMAALRAIGYRDYLIAELPPRRHAPLATVERAARDLDLILAMSGPGA